MKSLVIVISLSVLLCFTFSCKQGAIDSDKVARVIYDAFKLDADDKLEIIEFSLESKETAIAKFRLNGNQLSSRIKKTDAGWLISEIQNKKDEWVPAENFLKIEGKILDNIDRAFANQTVTLYELIREKGELSTSIKVGKGGILLNPSAQTDSGGNFTIIADRRFWEGSGMFTLGASVMGREVYLSDPNNIIISVKVDKKAKQVDLGEIRARY